MLKVYQPELGDPPKRILVIRLRQLGDSLLVTPLLRQLRRLYPQAQIDVLCQPQNEVVFRHNRAVAQRILLRRGASLREFFEVAHLVRGQKYDWVLDSQSLPKTGLLALLSGAQRRVPIRDRMLVNALCHTDRIEKNHKTPDYSARLNLKLVGDPRIDMDDLALDFPIGDVDRASAMRFAHMRLKGPTVAMYVAATHPQRCWPADRFAALADRFADSGFMPLLVYGPGQEPTVKSVQKLMRRPALVDYPMLSFPELRGVMEQCTLFVGNDGGPLHVAISAGIPTVSLFRLNPSSWVPPNNPNHRFLASMQMVSETQAQGVFLPQPFFEIPIDEVWRQAERVLSGADRQVA